MGTEYILKIDYPADVNVETNYTKLCSANPGATTGTLRLKVLNSGKKVLLHVPQGLQSDDVIRIVTHGSWIGLLLGISDGKPVEFAPNALSHPILVNSVNLPKTIDLVACRSYRSAKDLAGLLPGTKVFGYLASVTISEGFSHCVEDKKLYGRGCGRMRFHYEDGQLYTHGVQYIAEEMAHHLDAEDREAFSRVF